MNQFSYKELYRRNLPHIQPPGATLFITFRLAGSIPTEVLRALLEERDNIERKMARITDKQERAKRAYLAERKLFGEWDNALDTLSNGPYWLRDDEIAKLVAGSLHHLDNSRYRLDAFCIMPNHVHLVCAPLEEADGIYFSMSKIMHSLKRHTARHANQVLNRSGDFWEHENYDHYARDETEFQRIVNYVLNNPVKAGLVSKPEDWKWSFCRTNL